MATQKNRINAYVDDEAYKAFEAFCQQQNTSNSKGVELLIKQSLVRGNVINRVPAFNNDVLSNVNSNADSNTLSNVEIEEKIHSATAPLQKEIAVLKELIEGKWQA